MKNKITAIIVDDESNAREVLRELLGSYCAEVEILGEADNADVAYKLIDQLKPQLVFLDIQMPKAGGFSLLKKYTSPPFEVIFVTSYDEYAINAIKFSALDYLLKPVEVKDLIHAVKKAKQVIDSKLSNAAHVINLLHNMDSDKSDRRIAVHEGDNVSLIRSGDILYIESVGRYCEITTEDNRRHMAAKYLKDFEDYFGEQSDFVCIHKGCIINIKQIETYSKGEPCFITMRNKKEFEVARRKKQEVLERLKG